MIPAAETKSPKTLDNSRLISELKLLVQSERKITAKIVEFIKEVERRRLFLQRGFTSLFSFLVEELGYTPSSAQRRIDAARLSREIPEIKQGIASGDLNLAQVSMLARNLREKRKVDSTANVSVDRKRALLRRVKNQNLQKTELIFAQELNILVKAAEKKVVQRDESVRLEVTLSKSEMHDLDRVRDLISHAHPGMKFCELVVFLAKEYLKRKDPAKKADPESVNEKTTAAAVVRSRQDVKSAEKSKYVPAKTRKLIFHRDQCCQWRDPKTGKRCGSHFQLQIDHKKSRWRGGDNSIENLQLLCSTHNRLKYEVEAGQIELLSDVVVPYLIRPSDLPKCSGF